MRRIAIFALAATALGTAAFASGALAASARGGAAVGGGHAMSAAPSVSGHAAPSFSGHASSGVAAAPSGRAAGTASPGFAASPGFNHGFGRRHHHHRGFGAVVAPGYAYDYSDDTSDYGDNGYCTQLRRVATPWGWQWQRVWVC
jgi:hypothetical protein